MVQFWYLIKFSALFGSFRKLAEVKELEAEKVWKLPESQRNELTFFLNELFACRRCVGGQNGSENGLQENEIGS